MFSLLCCPTLTCNLPTAALNLCDWLHILLTLYIPLLKLLTLWKFMLHIIPFQIRSYIWCYFTIFCLLWVYFCYAMHFADLTKLAFVIYSGICELNCHICFFVTVRYSIMQMVILFYF